MFGMAKKKEASFEQNLQALQDIIDSLDEQEPNLEELLAAYTQGVELSKKCMSAIDKAEKTMDILVKENKNGIEELELQIEGE